MSGINFRNTGWTHNQLSTGGAGSGGQGRRNFYMASPEGATEANEADYTETSALPTSTYQPLSFNQIEQVDLSKFLPKEEI